MKKLEIKIKLGDNAKVPKYSKEGDAGLDLVATSMDIVDENTYGYIEYGTNLFLEIPKGYEGQIRPRSSISKTGLILANSPGTIDSGYRGEIKVRFKAIPGSKVYDVGDRIAQLLIKEVPFITFKEVENLTDSSRGKEGFGSTGK